MKPTLGISLILLSIVTLADAATLTLDQLRDERKRMAHRQRRIIYNNDGEDLAMLSKEGWKDFLVPRERGPFPVTAEGLLEARTTALLGSQVDTICYYSTWGMKLHHGDGPFGRLYRCPDSWVDGISKLEPDGISTKNYEKILADTGKDCLEIMIDTCRKHGLEIFYSNRMNDWHDSFQHPGVLYYIRQAHPEWSLSTRAEGAKYQYPDVRSCWSPWNFEVPEIRQLTVDALREVCRNYDVDGIELDFLRGTTYFKPTMQLQAVEQKHLDLMNDLMRQIRAMTEEEGLRRGRPILIMARMTDDVPLSKSIGLDVETWLAEGLIDLLQIGSWIDMDVPLKPVIELSHRHGVPVYPFVHAWFPSRTASTVRLRTADKFKDKAVWRGEALWRLWEGADGVYTFNVFDPELWLWSELGDPAAMAGKDRTYVWDYLHSQRAVSDVLSVVRLTRFCRPVEITKAGGEAIPLFVGEDPSSPPPDGTSRALTLRVRVQNIAPDQKLIITANGTHLDAAEVSEAPNEETRTVTFSFQPDPAIFKGGENRIEGRLEDDGQATIDDVRLEVRFTPADN